MPDLILRGAQHDIAIDDGVISAIEPELPGGTLFFDMPLNSSLAQSPVTDFGSGVESSRAIEIRLHASDMCWSNALWGRIQSADSLQRVQAAGKPPKPAHRHEVLNA